MATGAETLPPLLAVQEQTTRTLLRHIPAGREVAVLDFPRHHNAGDALIWVGTRKFLAGIGAKVRFVADLHHFNPSELRRVMPRGVVLIQGGGNLGDKWRRHQDFRLHVLKELPDYPVVQLSQGLDFTTDAAAAESARAFASHPDFTLLVRDHEGVARARRLFPDCTVDFCPDVSLGVGMLPRVAPASVPVLMLLRRDLERVPRDFDVSAADGFETCDWGLVGSDAVRWRALRLPEDVVRVVNPSERLLRPAIAWSFEAMADINVLAARRILARGRVVVTDRLHAMILAALSGIPVVALENSNGKVRAVHRDYLGTLPNTHLARDARQALEMAAQLLDSPLSTSGALSIRSRG